MVVNFEKDCSAVSLERAKVVFFARIVGMAKIIIHRDGLDDAHDRFGPEGGDPRGNDSTAVGQVATQFVIERANSSVLTFMVGLDWG